MANNLATRLRELLFYDPETGIFTWKVKRPRGVKPGSVAGNKRPDGYIVISIDGRRYKAHRLAWLYMTGQWPPAKTDHKDGNPSNNRFSNLRPATQAQNCWNTVTRSDTVSGVKGVSWHKRSRSWQAHITANRRTKSLGYYKRLDDAAAARRQAEAELHGEYRRAA